MRKAHVMILSIALLAVLITPLAARACGGGGPVYPPPQTRMAVGVQGVTAYTASGDPLTVREEPGLNGKYLTQLYNGVKFTVVDGSQEMDNFIWWKITTADGVTGWVAEGEYGDYYIQPLGN